MDLKNCPRCSGKGEIVMFRHVKAGVCFACWGCGLDLRSERRAIVAVLEGLRTEYRQERRASGPQSPKLADIVTRGQAAAEKLRRHDADVAQMAAKHRAD